MQKIYIILKDITESGGGERVCVNLANAFSESGFEVSVISFFRFQDEIPFTLNENINVRFLSHTTPKSKNPFKKLFNKSIYRYILGQRADKILQQEKPDIVLANDGYYIPKTKLDSIQYIRLWHLNAPKKIDKRKQKIFNLFDTLVVLSPRELDIWQNYHKNIKVIPNFLPFISNKNTDSNQHRIISVGRMDNGDQKGFLRLIDIWEKVQEKMKAGLESTPLEQVQNVRVQNSETLESNPCSTNSPHCHTEQSEVSDPCHTPTSCRVERSETSKNLESKKDISPFLKARTIRKDFAHTCKYDNITIQNDNHEKNLDSYSNGWVQGVGVQNCKILDSTTSCHFERSEKSSIETKKDISCLRTQYDKNLDSKQISAKTATHKKGLESWQLIIVGSGILQEQIESKIKAKNLQNTIILKPFTKDIESEYLNASIYAMTSHFEGFGMVLVEASSYALPCIAFDIAAGPSDIIESHTSGYLIQDNDLQDYADKLIELMSNKEKREFMGLKAKRKVSTSYSKEAVMNLWQEIFNN